MAVPSSNIAISTPDRLTPMPSFPTVESGGDDGVKLELGENVGMYGTVLFPAGYGGVARSGTPLEAFHEPHLWQGIVM